ncbi:MAG: hypothetical protein AAFX54_17520 [Pseudomonadota bacterium]
MKRIKALLALVALLAFSPASADQWKSPEAYEPVVKTYRPLIVILDMTTFRPQAALADASILAEALMTHMPEGKPLVIYHDYGERLDLATPREGIVKPTVCVKRHPIFEIGRKPCSTKGYEKAHNAFFHVVDAAFAPYFERSDASQSRPFTAIATAATDHSLGRNVGGDIFYITDGLPYSDVARFSPGADWLNEGESRNALQEELMLRGLLPDLRGYRLHMVGVGRTLNGDSTLSAEAAGEIVKFWTWYASLTGASLSIFPNFGTASIELMKNLESVE